MGGSILPITIHNGKIYFLFGKERAIDENPGWSDFGGGTDKGETFVETATREGSEESTGFLGSSTDVKNMMKKYGTFTLDYIPPEKKYSTYRVHILPMKYNPFLVHYYNNNQKFIQSHLDKKIIRDTKIFEKPQIKWWSFDQIKKNRNEFRKFYRNIIDMILNKQTEITNFVSSKLRSKSRSRPKCTNKRTIYRNKNGTFKAKKTKKANSKSFFGSLLPL
jgi:hypothetical protein